MRRFNLLLISFLFVASAFGQTQKTFIKSFPINDNVIALNLDGEVEVKEWDETFVRVHTNVALDNANTTVLKLFLVQGRYNLQLGTENGIPTITSAERSPNVKYRGQILNETVSYTVFIPRFMEVKGNEEVQKPAGFSSK